MSLHNIDQHFTAPKGQRSFLIYNLCFYDSEWNQQVDFHFIVGILNDEFLFLYIASLDRR